MGQIHAAPADDAAKQAACKKQGPRRLILIGPPGCGKGTQGPKIADDFCVCQLSTGDILRDAVSKGTELGKKADDKMKKGELVDDELVLGIVAEAMDAPECANGFILDGSPRTLIQAHAIDAMMAAKGWKLDAVLEFKLNEQLLLKRITGRRVHKASGRSYHIEFNPPKVPNVDDLTGEPLMQRKDDTAEALTSRLKAFHEATEPVVTHYKGKGVLVSLNADQPINTVYDVIKAALLNPPTAKKN